MTHDKEYYQLQTYGNKYIEHSSTYAKLSNWHNLIIAFFIFMPIISLSLSAIMWLRYSADIPFWDDWRSYDKCQAGLFSIKTFFTPANGTLYPIGQFLDFLSQLFLDGNTVAYQFISMVFVQGTLLILQWRLLAFALKDRLLAASAFSLSILMLQPDSYWGLQNIAYHQALPLICILSSLCIIVTSSWKNWWNISALFVLGILSGMSYTSGAFTILTVGIVCFIAAYFVEPAERGKYRWGGLALIVAGVLTSVPQASVVLVVPNPILRGRIIPGTPNEIAFWAFALGKLGRSLLLPVTYPVFSLWFSILAVVMALALMVRFVLRTMKGLLVPKETGIAVIYISLLLTIFVYLLMVAFGRTHLQAPGAQRPIQFFLAAFARFHFYWVTLLWPWVMAACLHAARRPRSSNPGKLSRTVAVGLPLVVLPLLIGNGALGHSDRLRENMQNRLDGIRCCLSKIQNGEPLECPQLYYRDLTQALRYAASIDASFIRSLPVLPPVGTDEPPPLFRLSKTAEKDVEMLNATVIEQTSEGYRLQAAARPQFLIRTGAPKIMKSCANLSVTGMLRVSEPGLARLYFKVPGQTQSSWETPKLERLQPDRWQTFTFSIFSPVGFADELRFEPVEKPQVFELKDIEVRCVGFSLMD